MNQLKKISFLLLLFACSMRSFSVVPQDKETCDFFTSFFQSKETISFLRPPGNNVINAYDPDSILTRCHISSWAIRKLNIITEGSDIHNIREYGIFTPIKDTSDFITVSKNTIKNITYYRIFRPGTGQDGHYGIKLGNKIQVRTKAIYGHI